MMNHERDALIRFVEEGHCYTYIPNDKNFTSVTTTIHKHFPTFRADQVLDRMQRSGSIAKYGALTREEIKAEWERNRDEAAQAGTNVHRAIELHLTQGIPLPEIKECGFFAQFWADKKPSLELYRSEWVVYDEDIGLAGSIDCVLRDTTDGRLVIVDWKRSKIKMDNPYERGYGWFRKFDHCNFNHYTLQVNFYRHILENKYGLSVKGMLLVVLHPEQENYEYYVAPRVELDEIWPNLTK